MSVRQSRIEAVFLNPNETTLFLLKTLHTCNFLLLPPTLDLLQLHNKKAFFASKTFPAPGPSGGIHPTSAQAVVPDLPALGIFWSGFFV
jgi:hypothetical protein